MLDVNRPRVIVAAARHGAVTAAAKELHVGLDAGRVRLAGFASANGALVPPPALEWRLTRSEAAKGATRPPPAARR